LKLRGKTELQERLAAEYALGTLRGAARRRFERWLREDASLGLAVARWEARLAPLTAGVTPVPPPARLWRAIEGRLGRAAARGWWDSLALWRALALFAGGTAAALFMVVVVLTAPSGPVAVPAPIVLRAPANDVGYVAVLSDPKTEKPVIFVTAGRDSKELSVRTLEASIRVPGKSLELWALPAGGAPKSLGLVSAEEKGTLELASVAETSLGNVPKLAVSLEPEGGSPTGAPSGPVLFSGPCVKYW